MIKTNWVGYRKQKIGSLDRKKRSSKKNFIGTSDGLRYGPAYICDPWRDIVWKKADEIHLPLKYNVYLLVSVCRSVCFVFLPMFPFVLSSNGIVYHSRYYTNKRFCILCDSAMVGARQYYQIILSSEIIHYNRTHIPRDKIKSWISHPFLTISVSIWVCIRIDLWTASPSTSFYQ